MLRFILLSILITFIARAFWRVIDGVIEGMRGGTAPGRSAVDARAGGGASGRAPAAKASVAMERDPVCGTFVVPERAIALADASGTHYFCSPACRDAYQPKQGSRLRPGVMRDRTA